MDRCRLLGGGVPGESQRAISARHDVTSVRSNVKARRSKGTVVTFRQDKASLERVDRALDTIARRATLKAA
jgi:hypothetical protein